MSAHTSAGLEQPRNSAPWLEVGSSSVWACR